MISERIKGWLSTSSKMVAASARLAKKQAELTTLNNVTLPRLYHALGKRIIGSKSLPADLAPHREKIHKLEALIATKLQEPERESPAGFAAKAKQVAQKATAKTAKAAADASAKVQIQAAYVSLGKAATGKYGVRAMPGDIASEFDALQKRLQSLGAEVAQLEASHKDGLVSPRRLVFATIAVALVATLVVGRSWLISPPSSGGNDDNKAAASSVTMADTSREQSNTSNDREKEASHNSKAGEPGVPAHVDALSNVELGGPVVLAELPSRLNFNDSSFRQELFHPARDLPTSLEELAKGEPRTPSSVSAAVTQYEEAIANLQKCPLTLNLQINRPAGNNKWLAVWQGKDVVLEGRAEGCEPGRHYYIPVTSDHLISFGLGKTSHTSLPLLVQADAPDSNTSSRDAAHAKHFGEARTKVVHAARWVVVCALSALRPDMPAREQAAKVLASLKPSVPGHPLFAEALVEIAESGADPAAPGLWYALTCRDRKMIAFALSNEQITTTDIAGSRACVLLPAECAVPWTTWFRSLDKQEPQESLLQILHSCGAQWRKQDSSGRNALMHALLARQNNAASVFCADRGSAICKDKEGRTALMYALTNAGGMAEKILEIPGATAGADRNGDNALHYCNRYVDLPLLDTTKAIVDRDASLLSSRNKAGDLPLHVLTRLLLTGKSSADFAPELWNPWARYIVSKGGDGAAVNDAGESVVDMLTQAEMLEHTCGFLFPESYGASDRKSLVRLGYAIALADKGIVTLTDDQNGQTLVARQDAHGRTVAKETVDGAYTIGKRAWLYAGDQADNGSIIFTVGRDGRLRQIVALNPELQMIWKSAPMELVAVAVMADGTVLAHEYGGPGKPPVLVKYSHNGKELWRGDENGPLRPDHSSGPASIYPERWTNPPAGIAAIFSRESPGNGERERLALTSISSDRQILVRAFPFPAKNTDTENVGLLGVFADGRMLAQFAGGRDIAFFGKLGKQEWELTVGKAPAVLQLKNGDLLIVSEGVSEHRVTRVTISGKRLWETSLPLFARAGEVNRLREGGGGVLFVDGRHEIAFLSPDGKVRARAKQRTGPIQASSRVFADGTIVWPCGDGGFIVGDYKKWPH